MQDNNFIFSPLDQSTEGKIKSHPTNEENRKKAKQSKREKESKRASKTWIQGHQVDGN